ncbi:MAG: hypothetical protein P8Y71_22700, partial [Pseudolabrys sp.]
RRAAHKTKRGIEELVAELLPQPRMKASIRRLQYDALTDFTKGDFLFCSAFQSESVRHDAFL